MTEKQAHNERDLFEQIARGDENAYALIFHAYNARLYPAVLKIIKSPAQAEEIIQNTFLKLWLHRHRLPEIEKPGAWLFRIASNLALSTLRNEAVYHRHVQGAGTTLPAADEDLQLALDAKELKQLIAEAVDILPASRQQIFRLSRYDGLSREEIAQKLGITESTVKNQLTSSIKFIREYIVKKQGIHLPLVIFLLFY